MKQQNTYERYLRQLTLSEFGENGQQKLSDAKVLVIGAGGLGCPALMYLVAAGVGTIGIVDQDTVQLSNLHRQLLFSTNDIGTLKANRAAEILQILNPLVRIIPFQEKLTTKNAFSILQSFDIIIDGTDNFSTKYLINDACVLLDKILVYGAVSRYDGQVAVFNKADSSGMRINYRDLFPNPPQEFEVLDCSEAGVLGVLPGIIGTMQATETIKLITGIGNPLIGKLLTYNCLSHEIYMVNLVNDKQSSLLIPATQADFENTDYEWLCGAESKDGFSIDEHFFQELLSTGSVDVIDVREHGEHPSISGFPHQHIPLNELENEFAQLKKDTIITICQSGKRSRQAAKKIAEFFGPSKKVYSLRGGILAWKQRH